MRILLLSLPLVVLAGDGASGGDAGSTVVPLPGPRRDGEVAVEAALEQRRSVREYADGPLALAEVAQVLWAAQGVTDPGGHRTAPSAGALYPLEVYLVAGQVTDLPAGVYRYRPGGHDLLRVATGDVRPALSAAALGQDWLADAPAIVAITGVFARTARKYGPRAERYVYQEAGHTGQNVALQAVADGLASVVVGAFRDAQVQQVLSLPDDHEPLALMPLGRPR